MQSTQSHSRLNPLDGLRLKRRIHTREQFVRYWPLAFYLALAILQTWPLATQMSTSVIGWPGDNVYYVWLIEWFKRALLDFHISPLWIPFHNSPDGWYLAYSEITFSNALLGLPFAIAWGPIFAYNAVILISYVLSGWFTYLWIKEMTGSQAAGLLAGVIFAFSPYRMAHVHGHLPLIATQWLALHYYGLYRLLARPDHKIRSGVVAALGLGLAALSSMYYLYMGLVLSLVFATGYLLIVQWRVITQKVFWQGVLAMGLVLIPLVLAAVVPYLQLAGQGDANHRPLEVVDIFSASPTDFFLPSPIHPLFGKAVETHFPYFPPLWIERNLSLGIVTWLLMAAALGGVVWIRDPHKTRLALWILLLVMSALVLAMGTTLHWLGEPVVLENVPEFLQRWDITARGAIPLPNYLLWKYLPYYNGMRVWMRYGIFAVLFASAAAGIGLWLAASRLGGKRQVAALAGILMALVLVDFSIRVELSELKPRAVDLWLASQPGEGSVVQFPIYQSTDVLYVYGSLFHNKPLFGMFYGAYLPSRYQNLLPALDTFPSAESIQILRERNVDYILVDRQQYADWSENWSAVQQLGLQEQAELDGVLVLTLQE